MVNVISHCFAEGTQIVVGMEYDEYENFVQYVTVNIEDIQVGDLVYSYDTATGEVSQKAVTSTSALRSDHINLLTIVDENGVEQTLETTDSHPFWVVTDEPDLERAARELADGFYHENIGPGLGGYWVEVKDLKVGDVFLGANGELSTLYDIALLEYMDGVAVYNFEVVGNHNYFVIAKNVEEGTTAVLAHNMCAKAKNTNNVPHERGNNHITVDEFHEIAKTRGWRKVKGRFPHGESVYFDPKNKVYISYDNTAHNGGAMKIATTIDRLNSIKTRMGTYIVNSITNKLFRIGN